MNYLAHIYLSRDHELISIGNFMAEHIKGNKYKGYSTDLQKGILLHRQIDSYTDAHEIVRKSKRRLDDSYGLYRGVIIDIFYDHFLAKNWKDYSDLSLAAYTQSFYDNLTRHYEVLPEKIQYMSKYLIKDDWLLSYAKLEGIQKVLEGMNRRTMDRVHMDLAINDLKDHYMDFEKDFLTFFDDLMLFTDNKLLEINKKYE
jgi:acyl carrier protein phosphodiesterase